MDYIKHFQDKCSEPPLFFRDKEDIDEWISRHSSDLSSRVLMISRDFCEELRPDFENRDDDWRIYRGLVLHLAPVWLPIPLEFGQKVIAVLFSRKDARDPSILKQDPGSKNDWPA